MDKVFGGGRKHVALPANADSDQDTLVSNEEEDEMAAEALDPHGAHGHMSMAKHVALTVGIVGCGFSIAYFVDDLQLGEFFVLDSKG